MQRFTQQWLILTLTGSAFFLGLDAFFGELPLLLFTLIGGVIADRHDRRHLLIASQSLQMVSALTLTVIVFFDVAQVHYILALSFLTGLAQAFGGPAFQSMIPSLVPRSTLPNAIALNSIQFNLAQMVGPMIGGVVLVAYGLAACFGINGLSFLVVIVVLSLMRLPLPPTGTRQRIMVELKGGLSYVRNNRALVSLTILAMATTSLGLPIRAFLPVFADDAAHFGRMMTALGGGSVVGALTIAWLGQFQYMGRTLLIVQIAFAALVVTFAVLPISAVTYVVLFLIGVTLLMTFSLTNSLVQLTVSMATENRTFVGAQRAEGAGAEYLSRRVPRWDASGKSGERLLHLAVIGIAGRGCERGLARAGRDLLSNVLAAVEESQLVQALDLLALDARLEGEIKLFRSHGVREL